MTCSSTTSLTEPWNLCRLHLDTVWIPPLRLVQCPCLFKLRLLRGTFCKSIIELSITPEYINEIYVTKHPAFECQIMVCFFHPFLSVVKHATIETASRGSLYSELVQIQTPKYVSLSGAMAQLVAKSAHLNEILGNIPWIPSERKERIGSPKLFVDLLKDAHTTRNTHRQ